MRIATKVTEVYKFSELLEGAPRERARDTIIGDMSEMGIITDDMRQAAAQWLRDEGWVELAGMAEGDGEDVSILQFSISHSQGDFVAWAASRPVGGWLPEGEVTVTTRMRHIGGGSVVMDVEVDPEYDGSDLADHIERLAGDMVNSHRAKVMRILSDTDMARYDDWEGLADFADANDYEFEANGEVYRG